MSSHPGHLSSPGHFGFARSWQAGPLGDAAPMPSSMKVPRRHEGLWVPSGPPAALQVCEKSCGSHLQIPPVGSRAITSLCGRQGPCRSPREEQIITSGDGKAEPCSIFMGCPKGVGSFYSSVAMSGWEVNERSPKSRVCLSLSRVLHAP